MTPTEFWIGEVGFWVGLMGFKLFGKCVCFGWGYWDWSIDVQYVCSNCSLWAFWTNNPTWLFYLPWIYFALVSLFFYFRRECWLQSLCNIMVLMTHALILYPWGYNDESNKMKWKRVHFPLKESYTMYIMLRKGSQQGWNGTLWVNSL